MLNKIIITMRNVENIGRFFGYLIAVTVVILFNPLFSTLLGVIGGWFVGLFFSDTILGFLQQIGIKGLAMWQVGAVLGFVSGFFRTALQFKNKK